MENPRKIGVILIIFALISFTLSKFLPWEAGYAIGFLFVIIGVTILAIVVYKATPGDMPGPGGAEYQSAIKEGIGFDFKSIPFLVLIFIGMYFALAVFHSMLLFSVLVITMLGILYYSRWLGLKVAYRGAQYIAKQDPVAQQKTFIILTLAVVGGLLFWYFVGRELPQKQSNTTEPSVISSTAPTANTSSWTTYRNEKYGFEFKLPPAWANYRVTETNPNQEGTVVSVAFGIKDQDAVFKTIIMTKQEYAACLQGELCPLLFIAQNDKNVFALAHAQDYSDAVSSTQDLTGQAIWDSIISSFRFTR